MSKLIAIAIALVAVLFVTLVVFSSTSGSHGGHTMPDGQTMDGPAMLP